MTDGLVLPGDVVTAIVDHVRRELPNEACGLLAAPHGSPTATRFHAARNALASRFAFEIEADDLIRILDTIDADGEELLGIVHSHPATAPVPSARDVRDATLPVVHLIVGSTAAPPDMRAWRIVDGAAREIGLRVEPAQQAPTERRSTTSPARGSTTSSSPQEPSSPPDR